MRIFAMPMSRPASTALIVLIGLAVPAERLPAADIYRWTDEQGQTHFGDRPPATGARQVQVPRSAPSGEPGTSLAKTQRLLQEFETGRAADQAEAAQRAQATAAREAACEEARNRMFEYEHAGYLYVWNERGEKQVLSDEDHAQALAAARRDVALWCE